MSGGQGGGARARRCLGRVRQSFGGPKSRRVLRCGGEGSGRGGGETRGGR